MEYLIFSPSILVPILLGVLILIAFVAIIAISIRRANQIREKRRREAMKMRKLAAAVSHASLVGQEMEEEIEKEKEVETVKSPTKKKASGDKTIYDDRKKLNAWQVHLSKTYREMKKKNPKTTFQAAMKAAKKTYKKAKK